MIFNLKWIILKKKISFKPLQKRLSGNYKLDPNIWIQMD